MDKHISGTPQVLVDVKNVFLSWLDVCIGLNFIRVATIVYLDQCLMFVGYMITLWALPALENIYNKYKSGYWCNIMCDVHAAANWWKYSTEINDIKQ